MSEIKLKVHYFVLLAKFTNVNCCYFYGGTGQYLLNTPKQVSLLRMFNILGINVKPGKRVSHKLRHQMRDSALSSCSDILLSTVSPMPYVTICERKSLKLLQTWQNYLLSSLMCAHLFYSCISLHLFYCPIFSVNGNFVTTYRIFHRRDHVPIK